MAPSASKAAGGTRTTSRVIISSPPTARTAGIGCFANGAAPGNGFCMATSPDGAPAYAELHCLTNFSFLRGASHPEELVRRAVKEGYQALAITDECSLAGVVRAHVEAKNHRIKIIIGAEFKLLDGPRLVLLATNKAGYGNLSQLITRARRAADKGSYQLCCDDLREDIHDCLALRLPNAETDLAQTRWLVRRFAGRCWLAVELLRGADDQRDLQARRALATALAVPLVASGDVHIHVRGRRADLCQCSLDELRYEYPHEVGPPGETPSSYLRKLTETGIRVRWPQGIPDDEIRAQIERELALIAELRYEPFFLTVYDLVQEARRRNILCQGRGSAANSLVCYCLGITEVSPKENVLLFERFISKERNEPPDIDVDFEHERREEIIQYIYEKYGRERAALAATVICYRPKSALRDVGKALGLDVNQLDRLSKSLAWTDWEKIESDRMREQGYDPNNPLIERWLKLANQLVGFPRHLSQHVGGFVISNGPLSRLVPIENAAMAERTVIQWEKDDLDAMGLLKVDVLALGMLSAIRRALALINDYHGTAFSFRTIPPEDPAVYQMLQRADAIGVFQVESRAQMAMLPRLKPVKYYDLVIEVALVRPGPIQGDMVHPYLRRRQGLERVTYPTPKMREALERTLGVPIFQEQVMQIAMRIAGFSGGEADQLRRALAAWRRKGGLEPFHRQVQGFGKYGFPESHAASFALLVYISAWLKCHHHAAFTAALLNSQPMGFYAPAQ